MPRHEKDWDTWFDRRDKKNRNRRRKQGEKVKEPNKLPPILPSSSVVVPRVVWEPIPESHKHRLSHIRSFAARRRATPTAAEKRLESILNSLNNGSLRGRFEREHVISGKWIVDFFCPEIRLAIEVDGSSRSNPNQRSRDIEKEADCTRFDITLLRLTNREVFGDRESLIRRLRNGWREAMLRENQIIGRHIK